MYGPEDDSVDILALLRRLQRGTAQILGLALLGFAIAVIIYLYSNKRAATETSVRVTFSFKGFDHGLYPDNSKFQPDDLRAPDVVLDALKQLDETHAESLQGKIRGALRIDGVVSAEIVKQRDRIRAAGQTPPIYVPDEYVLTFVLPRNFPLNPRQREQLLNEIVSAFRRKFQRTYEELPKDFGNAFESLRKADYLEYELILNEELQNITQYLTQRLEDDKSFRSPTTNLSYSDLLKQVANFSQIRMFETLGQVQVNGISKDRPVAMIKMDYHLRTLADRERRAKAEEEVIRGLLAKTQERAQGYILTMKVQSNPPRGDGQLLDQELVDSLVATSSYNFLVRRALDAGLLVKRLEAERASLEVRRDSLKGILQEQSKDQSVLIQHVDTALKELENAYHALIDNIRATQADYNRQQFADAVRMSTSVVTESIWEKLVMLGALGCGVGMAAGLGLSLMGIYLPSRPRA